VKKSFFFERGLSEAKPESRRRSRGSRFATTSSWLTRTVLGILFILVAVSALAEEATQKFPFVGKISQDNVNIRAGNNQNFEILSKLNSGNFALVTEESFGWYKVRLPQSAHCYVSKDFIEKNESGSISKAGNLNLRARPNKESSSIGQIKKGDIVSIVGEDIEGWYEILPPQGCYGWVKADFVSYYSNDVVKWEEENKPKDSKKITRPSPVAVGQVQNMGFTFRKRPGSHKLVSGGKSVYYLKSDKVNLKSYEGQIISVWGDILDLKTDKLVIDVLEVEVCK